MSELKFKTKTTTITTIDRTIELSGEAIINLLRAAGYDVDPQARVEFTTPGGGDWSNTAIDIDQNYPVKVSWRKVGDGS